MGGSPLDALDSVPGGDGFDQLTRRVVAVALVGLTLRVALLGSRVSHFDEGRVAWWSMHFLDTGQFEYRYIIHGPLVQHVNKFVFGVVGPSDFTMRLFVALVGAALPLSALLFREHLAHDEVLGVAAFLAVNPLLVYYSRFFRSTLLVAAFSLVAFGLLVRAADGRSFRYVHGAVVLVAFAFTAKENAVVYLLCWAGASALVVDHLLFRTGSEESGVDWLVDRFPDEDDRSRYRSRLGRYVGHVVLAVVLFVAVAFYFYAPRSPAPDAVGLWQGLTNPTQFPTVVDRTVADVVDGFEYWFGGSTEPGCGKENLVDGYLCYLGRSLETLRDYALPMMVLSVVGFVTERYARPEARLLVLFAAYWGFVSVLGYPLGTDIYGGWIMVNALIPLAVPAGVGLALVARWVRDSLDDDAVSFALAALVVVLVTGLVATSLVTGVYTNPTGDNNTMAQYAQPADDFRPAMGALGDRAPDHEGPDVLFVGERYVRESPRRDGLEPLCTSISKTLPLHWYVTIHDATGDCARTTEGASETLGSTDPIVVVAPASHSDDLDPMLEGYERHDARLRTRGSEAVFYVDRRADTTGG